MSQMLLFLDPRPLVERLGVEFFRQAPQCAGVYLMRDRADTVLYVGKAKNLRKRLASYRVANPDRMPRRHLRLLRAVQRIELEECRDETSALARESELLRRLRPRFNRAGTWEGTPRYLSWQLLDEGLAFAVAAEPKAGWPAHGPMGAAATSLRAALVRLLWCAVEPERRLWEMPLGWLRGRHGEVVVIRTGSASMETLKSAHELLAELFAGEGASFTAWVQSRVQSTHALEIELRQKDLETLAGFVERQRRRSAGRVLEPAGAS